MTYKRFGEREEKDNEIMGFIGGFGIVILLLLIIVPILPIVLLYKLMRRE